MNERQHQILEILKDSKKMSVKKLSQRLFVSEMTIRRDLAFLQSEGYIHRYSGGAIYNDEILLPIPYRKLLYSKEKSQLAQKVLPFLHDSMTVFIDGSTTCHYIVPLLRDYTDIRMVTNSVYNLMLAAQYAIPCTVIGGEYQNREMCMVGGMANQFLSELNLDIAFLSALGISEDGEITDLNEPLTAFRKNVLQRSRQSVFLFNSQKQNKKYMYTLCRSDAADAILFE